MKLEIRSARADEMEEFGRIVRTTEALPPERIRRWPPEFTLCVFEDGKMATTQISLPWTIGFNGSEMPVSAIASVGTLPIYRRRGYLRKLVTNHFEHLHEQSEQPMAILWAKYAAIYQRYGYAVVSTHNAYNIEPQYLKFTLAQSVPGTFREVGDADFRLMGELYQSFRSERTGYLRRIPFLWERNVLTPPLKGGVFSKVIYEEEGKPLGYLVYTIETVDLPTYRGQGFIIRDLVWLEISAYQAMWGYLSLLGLAGSILWRNVPLDDPLPHLLLEPRMLNVTSGDGIMARIVDVERALTLRRYPVAGTLTFEVIDELCPWNHGRWQLETSPAEASIQRTNASPQLRMPVSTLAMIIFNQISATEAARMGRLDVLEPGALSLWDAVMRTSYRPFCADHF